MASGRTLDGPQPKRPSAGSSAAGIWIGRPGSSGEWGVDDGPVAGSAPGRRSCGVRLAQAGADSLISLVCTVSQPSTASGLRGSGPT